MNDYTIVFDGGSKNDQGSDSVAYGSFLIKTKDGRERLCRLNFLNGATNNQAEYMSLVHGLEYLLAMIVSKNKSPARYSVEIRGDSKLVIEQLSGNWKVKDARLQELHDTTIGFLGKFKSYGLRWQPREESVAILGH